MSQWNRNKKGRIAFELTDNVKRKVHEKNERIYDTVKWKQCWYHNNIRLPNTTNINLSPDLFA